MVLRLSGDKAVVIKDAKGATVARASFDAPIADALWSGDEESVLIMTCDDTKDSRFLRIYRYSLKDSKRETISDNAPYGWDASSAKGHFIICRQISHLGRTHAIVPGTVSNPASLILLDAGSLKPVFTSGQNCGNLYTLSPDMRSIAYIELSEDEYGDYARCDLKVANIRTGKVMNPAFGRRPLKYIWAGNRAIAYIEPDKYDLLSVRLFNIDSGKTVTFISNLSVPALKLVAYDEETGILYYKILDTYMASYDDPVCWAVSLGGKPVSSEETSFPRPKSEAIRKLVMPGLYVKNSGMMGLPGMPPMPGLPGMPAPSKGAGK